MGISVAALSKIENGLTDLNLSRLIQIAQYFEVTITALIYGTAESLINVPAADDEELNSLKSKLLEKDIELMELQKKVIQLYEKLGL